MPGQVAWCIDDALSEGNIAITRKKIISLIYIILTPEAFWWPKNGLCCFGHVAVI
jgi:hypothetical protein